MNEMKFSVLCTFLFVLILFASYGSSLDNLCGNGWTAFKDEKCFIILDDITRTFADAEKACEKLEISPTLALVHSKDEQEFLSTFLFKTSKKLGNFWLGAKVVNSRVAWIDNSELGYTNWDTRNLAPRNKPNYCVQMEYDEAVVGKWIDEPCEIKNLVVCQKVISQTLTLENLNKIVLESQKESKESLDEANRQIANLKQILEREKVSSSKTVEDLKQILENEKTLNVKNIADLKKTLDESVKNIAELKQQNQIPIGFIYLQLPYEKSPNDLWPSMTWSDVSSTYGGYFFRVNGGGSEPFGQIQEGNAPRLVAVDQYQDADYHHQHMNNLTLNANTVSEWIFTGDYAKEFKTVVQLRFKTSGGEVRPRNMAIRVWKRIG